MPLNQYKCNKEKGGCGHTFEELQQFKDKNKKKCPECGKLKLVKLFGTPSFRLIGSGFYANDYKQQDIPN
jgi:putative FmdB family regulatory protein